MQNPRTPHALCWACKRPTDSRKRLESGVVQIWKERGPDPTVRACCTTLSVGQDDIWHFRKKWTPFLCRRYMQGNVLSANVRHQQPMASARLWTGSNFPASRVHRPFTVSSTETSTEIGSRPQKNARPGGWSFHQPAVLHHGHPRVRYPSPRRSSTCCPSSPFSPIVSTRSAEVRGARQLGTAGGDAVGGGWVGWSLCRRLAVTAARSLRRGRSRRWVEAGWEVVGRRLLPRGLGTAGCDAVGGEWAVKPHAVVTAGCLTLVARCLVGCPAASIAAWTFSRWR